MSRLARFVDLGRRALKKPPRVVWERAVHEAAAQVDRFSAPRLARTFGAQQVLEAVGATSIGALWGELAARPFILPRGIAWRDHLPTDEAEALRARADAALARKVTLLGAVDVQLGTPIDWHTDIKTGIGWAPRFYKDIEYNNLDRPSDVKMPWELSRMQWLLPVAQVYLLDGEERHAAFVRSIIEEWIAANPYAMSVNWSCTMDVALRLITWTWMFHVLGGSAAWADAGFRAKFLASLYLHGRFVERNLEKSEVNGNHYGADAAGLVFAGLFFGKGKDAARWQEIGWQILRDELPLQVTPDGVDYEASVPYHRLVAELFLFPAIYRLAAGLPVDEGYRRRVIAMGEFAASYARDDGTVPLVGDADDARTLPFGVQKINDHRYLVGLIAETFGAEPLARAYRGGPIGELLFLFGPERTAAMNRRPLAPRRSAAFAQGGNYVMANERDHVFIDCAPVGLAGRGGHGHNDCLSFEAVLDGVHLITDAGAYLYTASAVDRNLFRSTAYHNTPRIDGAEINRFIAPDNLWNLVYDAVPQVHAWTPGAEQDVLEASHAGYERLEAPVRVRRRLTLEHATHRLSIEDEFISSAAAPHTVDVPLLLAPDVTVDISVAGSIRLGAGGKVFVVTWSDPADWAVTVEEARVSPSYGVAVPSQRLVWRRSGALRPLRVTLAPGA
ncbi:MAG: hypothetical protein Devi2KO_25800 [Devosia indica]